MMSGSSGIGFFVWDAYNGSKLDQVVAAIVLIGGVGLVLDLAFNAVQRKLAFEEGV